VYSIFRHPFFTALNVRSLTRTTLGKTFEHAVQTFEDGDHVTVKPEKTGVFLKMMGLVGLFPTDLFVRRCK
jgi:hypothetical protein